MADTTYEQPLNEQIRTLLRLEHLYQQIDWSVDSQHPHCSYAALIGMLHVSDILSRTDIKSDLARELERHLQWIARLQSRDNVDREKLRTFVEEIDTLVETLRDSQCQPGQSLRNDELVQSVRKRLSIPGGACSFDLPGLHHWSNLGHEERHSKLMDWYSDLLHIRQAVRIGLLVLRDGAHISTRLAAAGFFQMNIPSQPEYQLLRVTVKQHSLCYPEISGNKHRFTVRFMVQPDTTQRPIQTDEDISFELGCCTA